LSEGSVALRIQVANVSRRFPQILVALLEQAMDIALDKKDVKRKRARRLDRQSTRRETRPEKSRPDEISSWPRGQSRFIPSDVRERVQERAGHQCEYRGARRDPLPLADGTRD
jgi:hypothetical protein